MFVFSRSGDSIELAEHVKCKQERLKSKNEQIESNGASDELSGASMKFADQTSRSKST